LFAPERIVERPAKEAGMFLYKLIGGDPPRDTSEKIGGAIGDVIGIGIWLMMFWVVWQAI
jgi:hypothetical protein